MELKVIATSERKPRNAYQDESGEIYLDCTKCGEVKKLDEFPTDRKMKFYQKTSYCKACGKVKSKKYYEENQEQRRAASKIYRENNKEYLVEYRRIYRENNKERLVELGRNWYENNKERNAELRRSWRENNKEKAAEILRNWDKDNPERRKAIKQKRRATKKGLPNTLTGKGGARLLQIQSGSCYLTGEGGTLDLEHFIPLSWGVGGTTYENCYYMSSSLNYSKGTKNPFEWIKTQPESYQDNFYNILVPELAARNEMSIEEFVEYVYQCEENTKNAKELVL